MATTSITVDQIVGGAEAIRKMRWSIETTISTVVGLLSNDDLETLRKLLLPLDAFVFFQADTFVWRIHAYSGLAEKPERIKILSICLMSSISYDCKDGSCFTVDFVNKKLNPDLKLQHVLAAYNDLQVFLDGMVSTFPSLAGKLKPFVDAAKLSHH